jgi:hypothetical protein
MIATCRSGVLVGLLVALASVSAAGVEFPALIEQLDSPDFASRQEASRQLAEAGADAMPALEQAIARGSREASSRALDLLKRQLHEGSEDAKASAREALTRLAASTNASTAQRARDVLNPPAERTAAAPFGQIPVPNGRRGFNNNVQFQAVNNPFQPGNNPANPAGFFAGVRRVSYSEINGRRGVEIAEQHRVINMDTWPNGAIEIAITDKLNGREVTRRIQAKDREDLARKDPETGKMYDQFYRRGAPGLLPGFGLEQGPVRFNTRPLLR